MKRHFNFGHNWKNYSANVLDEECLNDAVESLDTLIGAKRISGASFLDVGCGSGIFSIAAKKLGAEIVVGLDISKDSVDTSMHNKKRFAEEEDIQFIKYDILDGSDGIEAFDIVYSWGVLHHTGNMWQALINTMRFVKGNGIYVISIYNKHWTSPVWLLVKYIYNVSPQFIKMVMVWFFYIIIAFAKFIVTKKNPFLKKRRGMNFYYDVVDWIGGYPYEYASKKDIQTFIEKEGYTLIDFNKAEVPTGCNEYVFRKNG